MATVLSVGHSSGHFFAKNPVDEMVQGALIGKTGVMSIVLTGDIIRPGDAVVVQYPPETLLVVVAGLSKPPGVNLPNATQVRN